MHGHLQGLTLSNESLGRFIMGASGFLSGSVAALDMEASQRFKDLVGQPCLHLQYGCGSGVVVVLACLLNSDKV